MDSALMKLPLCPTHKTPMHYRARCSREQIYCGTWYYCDTPGCSCSVLLPSKELLCFLASTNEKSPVI